MGSALGIMVVFHVTNTWELDLFTDEKKMWLLLWLQCCSHKFNTWIFLTGKSCFVVVQRKKTSYIEKNLCSYDQIICHITYRSVFDTSVSSFRDEIWCVTGEDFNISSIMFIFRRTSSQQECLRLSDFTQFCTKFSRASILEIMVLHPAEISAMRFSILANRWLNASFKLDTSLLQVSIAERIVVLSTLARFRRGTPDIVKGTNYTWKVEQFYQCLHLKCWGAEDVMEEITNP